jgi:cytochrome P450
MCWIINYLTQHPRVQIRLHEELTASLRISADFSVPYDDLQSTRFPYLDAVISEAFRLANVAGVSARDGVYYITYAWRY